MLTTLLLTGLLAVAATAQNTSCVTGDAVHMIIARASLEPPGVGIIGGVATQVMAQLPGSDVVPVVYPATLANYTTSEAMGVAAMTGLVDDYASRCPDSKIVLMGYSQGAQVTADVMCGTMINNFAPTQALSTSNLNKGQFRSHLGDVSNCSDSVKSKDLGHVKLADFQAVAAAVLMGDPSKAMNETFLQGTSTKNGVRAFSPPPLLPSLPTVPVLD